MTERYHNVWARGYSAAAEDITTGLIEFLEEGGQIAVQPFTRELLVKHDGVIGLAYSVLALLKVRMRTAPSRSSRASSSRLMTHPKANVGRKG